MFCTPLYAMVPRNQAYWGSGCPHVSELRRVAPEGGPPSMCHSFPQSVIVALNVSELAAKNRSRMGLSGVPKVTLKELLNKHYYKTSFLTL
jgi:hypothetical protein